MAINDFVKLTDEIFERNDVEDIIKMLDLNTQDAIDFVFSDMSLDILCFIQNCESPIERKLGVSLWHWQLGWHTPKVEPQYEITVSDKKYRVDFYIEHNNKKLIVECDGHEFHEKTKSQVAKDKKRDRDFQIAGYTILHFTGSEIYNDMFCIQCIHEINKYFNG